MKKETAFSCAVSWQTDNCKAKAEILAKELQIPLIPTSLQSEFQSHYRYILYVTDERLELRALNPNIKKTLTMKDVKADFTKDFKLKIYSEFLTGPQGYRRLKGGGTKQLIARAVGLKKHPNASVLDATAGLGNDAFVLASLGCRVLLVERSPIIAALLEDGLKRAASDPVVRPIVKERMSVRVGDALEILAENSLDFTPDVVYLDPMFPTGNKSALAKVEMRIIREIVGQDEDAPALLEMALKIARDRVVVKRPAKAAPIANKTADFIVEGARNRYDVYIQRNREVILC